MHPQCLASTARRGVLVICRNGPQRLWTFTISPCRPSDGRDSLDDRHEQLGSVNLRTRALGDQRQATLIYNDVMFANIR
jgi:hypothetical protein